MTVIITMMMTVALAIAVNMIVIMFMAREVSQRPTLYVAFRARECALGVLG